MYVSFIQRDFFSRIHPGRGIGFIEEEAKTACTTLKRLSDTNAMPHSLQLNPHRQTIRTRLVPSSAKNGKDEIHQASRPRHNRRRELHETDSNSGKAHANALPAHKRLRVGE
jgi:hypothetical protein